LLVWRRLEDGVAGGWYSLPMARELDSEMLQRLQESYGAMSDGELLDLAAKPEELTDLANEVLRGEMARRRLELAPDEAAPVGTAFGRAGGGGAEKPIRAGAVSLMTFNDAIGAGEACRHLEDAGIEIDVRDVSETSTVGGSFYGGPPVALQVVVAGADVTRAQKILREKMKLFPLKEVEGEDAPDEAAVVVVASFGLREDADAVAGVLEEGGMWHRVTANPDGDVETEDAFTVEVREVDQEKALGVVEKAMGMGDE
jgi:hypothetical protein